MKHEDQAVEQHIIDHHYHSDHQLYTYHADSGLLADFPYYARLMQEAASHHADLAGCSNPQLFAAGKTWVLSRVKFIMTSYPAWPAKFHLETWIHPPMRLFAPRECRAVCSDTGTLAFRSIAYWIVIDLASRRPERPDRFLDHIGLQEDRTGWWEERLERLPDLPEPTDPSAILTFDPQILYRDIDSNLHVNNIAYIEWLLDAMPFDFRRSHRPASVEVHFLAESFHGETLRVQAVRTHAPDEGELWEYAVRRRSEESETLLCRARIVWKRLDSFTI